MATRPNCEGARILCIEPDVSILETRRLVLNVSGYDAISALPQPAEIVLRNQKFDLVVVSGLRDFDLHRIVNLVDGADVLVLKGFTMPVELLSLVAERLNGHQQTT